MKHILSFIAAAILATVFISSCKKDDDNSPKDNTPNIVGAWSFNKLATDKPSGYDMYYGQKPSLFSDYESARASGSTLTFEQGDNTGNTLIYDNCQKSNDNGAWTLQSNVLTIDGIDFQVAQMDNATLRLTHSGGTYGDIDPVHGYIEKGKITDTFVFKRN